MQKKKHTFGGFIDPTAGGGEDAHENEFQHAHGLKRRFWIHNFDISRRDPSLCRVEVSEIPHQEAGNWARDAAIDRKVDALRQVRSSCEYGDASVKTFDNTVERHHYCQDFYSLSVINAIPFKIFSQDVRAEEDMMHNNRDDVWDSMELEGQEDEEDEKALLKGHDWVMTRRRDLARRNTVPVELNRLDLRPSSMTATKRSRKKASGLRILSPIDGFYDKLQDCVHVAYMEVLNGLRFVVSKVDARDDTVLSRYKVSMQEPLRWVWLKPDWSATVNVSGELVFWKKYLINKVGTTNRVDDLGEED